MEMGWRDDIWDFRINWIYAQNLPLLRAGGIGGSLWSIREAWRDQNLNKKSVYGSYCSPFQLQRKNPAPCKEQRTPTALGVPHCPQHGAARHLRSQSQHLTALLHQHTFHLSQSHPHFFAFSGKPLNNQVAWTDLPKAQAADAMKSMLCAAPTQPSALTWSPQQILGTEHHCWCLYIAM